MITLLPVSDLHLDFLTSSFTEKKSMALYDRIIGVESDVLVIAGDLSHYISQSKTFLSACSKHNKHVLFVPGNHELYNISDKQRAEYTTLTSKMDKLKNEVSHLTNVHILQGDHVDIDGFRFAGAMGWYDCSYYYRCAQGLYTETVLSHWCSYTNDSRRIPTLNDPFDLFATEKLLIDKALATEPDVMITHFCPISDPIAIEPRFQNDRSTGYYCFDYQQVLADISSRPAIWVHGHMHAHHEFHLGKTLHYRNPLGYPGEKSNFTTNQIILEKP